VRNQTLQGVKCGDSVTRVSPRATIRYDAPDAMGFSTMATAHRGEGR